MIKGVVISLFIYPVNEINSQNKNTEVDSTFEQYMSNAWEEIRNSGWEECLQREYSTEFYNYYLENPNTETGRDAFVQAFTLWANTGKSDYLGDALQSLDYDSGLWSKIVMSFGGIYSRNEDLVWEFQGCTCLILRDI